MTLKTNWLPNDSGLSGAVNAAATLVNDHETQLTTRLSPDELSATIAGGVAAEAADAGSDLRDVTDDLYAPAGQGRRVRVGYTASASGLTVPSGVAGCNVTVVGAGGGGGSGRRGATSTLRGGGGGGGAGGVTVAWIPATQLGATFEVVVAAQGGFGSQITVDSTDGNDGGDGGSSSFASGTATVRATGGKGGKKGTSAGGGLGGAGGKGTSNGVAGGAADAAGGNGAKGESQYGLGSGGGGGGAGLTAANANANGGGGGGAYAFGQADPANPGGTSSPFYAPANGTLAGPYQGMGGAGGGSTVTGGSQSGSHAAPNSGGGGGGGGAAINGQTAARGGFGGAGYVEVEWVWF